MLSGVNTLIVRVPDRDTLFEEACRIAVEAGGFRMAMLVILDRSSAKLVPVASAGKDEELINDIKTTLSSDELAPRTMVARAIKEKRTIISNNSESDPQVVFSPKYAAAGVRSMIVLPLMVEEEAMGVIALYSEQKDFFHAEEMQLLTELASDIAFALDNIGKQKKLANLARVRALSGKINAAIIRIHDREELLRETCRIAVESGGFRLAWAGVVDPSDMTLKPLACEGTEQRFLEQMPLSVNPADGKKFGLAGLAVREKKPIVVEDMQRDPRIARRVEAGRRELHSMVTLPLLVADTVVGVLALYTKEMGFFDANEMQLLPELSGNISFALDHIEKAEQIDYLAYYDALTGLANRTLFLERLAQYMRSAVDGGHKLAVFLIDLERFKNINDSLGRAAGDALLRQVAKWLKRNAGDANLLARMGADHFASVLPQVRQDGNLGAAAREMDAILAGASVPPERRRVPHRRQGRHSAVPRRRRRRRNLVQERRGRAEKGQDERRSLPVLYAEDDRHRWPASSTWKISCARRWTKSNSMLHYQPKMSLASGKLTGAEALIRWNDPRTGLVPPGRFIPILEETGLIHEVGRWALRQAIADYLRWRSAGLACRAHRGERVGTATAQSRLHRRGQAGHRRSTRMRRRGWSWRSPKA